MKRRELDRLLGRGRLSRPEKEAILDEALPQRAAPRWSWLGWRVVAPLATLGLLAFVLLRPGDGGWRAKGSHYVGDSPIVFTTCGGPCTRGSTLMFEVGFVPAGWRLAAFAVGPSGERIWYFPTDAGELPAVPRTRQPAVLPRGVRIGPEHAPGKYHLTFLLLDRPWSRDALAHLFEQQKHPGDDGVMTFFQDIEIVK